MPAAAAADWHHTLAQARAPCTSAPIMAKVGAVVAAPHALWSGKSAYRCPAAFAASPPVFPAGCAATCALPLPPLPPPSCTLGLQGKVKATMIKLVSTAGTG